MDVFIVAKQCLHSIKAFSISHFASAVYGLGLGKRLGRAQPGQLIPTDRKDIPYCTISCSTIRLGGIFQGLLLLGDWLGVGVAGGE